MHYLGKIPLLNLIDFGEGGHMLTLDDRRLIID